MLCVVYLRICLLFVVCGCQVFNDEEDLSNDDPFSVPNHKIEDKRVSNGTPFTLECNEKRAKWYFKPCEFNINGLICKKGYPWKKVKNKTRGKLEFDAAHNVHNGLYRCSQEDVTLKMFRVYVVDPSYNGHPPKVYPMEISNITAPINMEFTIQCKVTSEVPPSIIWFKSCYRQKCDLWYESTCLCHINTSLSSYNSGSTYFTKYLIFNARDVDSGTYICLAVSQFGKDHQNVTISVPCKKSESEFYSLLFLIPFALLIVPLTVYCAFIMCYYNKKKKKHVMIVIDPHKQLIRGQTNRTIL